MLGNITSNVRSIDKLEIFDEWNPTNSYHISSEDLLNVLKHIKENYEYEIDKIKNKIHQYEQKKKSEEAFYRSLSPVRRFFTGRAPNHHQAVEHMVHVKERMRKIAKLKQRVAEVDRVTKQLEQDTSLKELSFPQSIFEEMIRIHEMEE